MKINFNSFDNNYFVKTSLPVSEKAFNMFMSIEDMHNYCLSETDIFAKQVFFDRIELIAPRHSTGIEVQKYSGFVSPDSTPSVFGRSMTTPVPAVVPTPSAMAYPVTGVNTVVPDDDDNDDDDIDFIFRSNTLNETNNKGTVSPNAPEMVHKYKLCSYSSDEISKNGVPVSDFDIITKYNESVESDLAYKKCVPFFMVDTPLRPEDFRFKVLTKGKKRHFTVDKVSSCCNSRIRLSETKLTVGMHRAVYVCAKCGNVLESLEFNNNFKEYSFVEVDEDACKVRMVEALTKYILVYKQGRIVSKDIGIITTYNWKTGLPYVTTKINGKKKSVKSILYDNTHLDSFFDECVKRREKYLGFKFNFENIELLNPALFSVMKYTNIPANVEAAHIPYIYKKESYKGFGAMLKKLIGYESKYLKRLISSKSNGTRDLITFTLLSKLFNRGQVERILDECKKENINLQLFPALFDTKKESDRFVQEYSSVFKYVSKDKFVNLIIKYIKSKTKEMQHWSLSHMVNSLVNDTFKTARKIDLLSKGEYKMTSKVRSIKELHDILARDIIRYKDRKIEFELKSDKKFNQTVDKFKFTLIQDSHKVRELGTMLHNCVYSYVDNILNNNSWIISVEDYNSYVACIEIDPNNNTVVQAKTDYNGLAVNDSELFKVCKEYFDSLDLDYSNTYDMTRGGIEF